jgi:large subunit ribosomal protein L17
MRHYKKGRKLGTDASHTKAMKISLVKALFTNDRIKTIEARAKEIRPDVDRIITWAKKGDLHSRRLAIAALGNDKDLVYEIFAKVDAGMFAGREGGYTRIMKLGNRKGDNAPIVIMELVREPVQKKADKKAEDKPAAKAAPKKEEPKELEAPAEEKVEETAEAEAPVEETAEVEAPAEEKKAE